MNFPKIKNDPTKKDSLQPQKNFLESATDTQ